MRIQWTEHALSDLTRLYDFLAIRNREAAVRTVRALAHAPGRLFENVRIGHRLNEFEPREVRRVLVGEYEVRYEIRGSDIYMLRLWSPSILATV
ncbi:MAG: type II toxin-antitoxin system RelE/ParE family toxin [Gemmatimonadaceae bacterium]